MVMLATTERFALDRSERWQELEALVAGASGHPERLGADGVRRLGERYRGVSADLAYARRAFPGDPVVLRLEALVAKARPLVYGRRERGGGILAFVRRGYWQSVREMPGLLALSMLLLMGSLLLAGMWAWRSPAAASGVVPAEFSQATNPPGEDFGYSVEEQAALSSLVMTNNIRVTLLAFGGGLLAGFGTALVLLNNGLFIGAIAGIAIEAGNGRAFFELVTAHGVLELSCIVVAGAAGLRLGRALISPGFELRSVVLQREARVAVGTLVGTAAWLVVAGVIEGFVTPSGFGLTAVIGVGLGVGALFWTLVMVLGRPTPAPQTV
jgi:uncharacterized membrane protein SpoIIM required for sporulation